MVGGSIRPEYNDPANHSGDYPPDWDNRRKRVYRRDDYTCVRCGRQSGPHAGPDGPELHAHHKRPLSEGGTNRLENLVTLCAECHDAIHDHNIFQNREGQTSEPVPSDSEMATAQRAAVAIFLGGTVGLSLLVGQAALVLTSGHLISVAAVLILSIGAGVFAVRFPLSGVVAAVLTGVGIAVTLPLLVVLAGDWSWMALLAQLGCIGVGVLVSLLRL